MSARVVSRNVMCLPDGQHVASYEGRGAHRDVYFLPATKIIMKLPTVAKDNSIGSNRLEAEALNKKTIFNRLHVCSFKGHAL